MSVLAEICARKREHIARKKAETPVRELEARLKIRTPPAGFISAVRARSGTAVIAEIKKASPSLGVIREDFDPLAIAEIYEEAGACCLSVLTDEPYFQGRDEYLAGIREITALPLLRKDFMLDPYQIAESRALGADCVLLIMAALDDSQAGELYAAACDFGMDALVEVHDRDELERALALAPQMIGVNNRSLKTLAVDIETSRDLAGFIPATVLKITESGISERETLLELAGLGYDGFLIGESLMRGPDSGAALVSLLQKA